MLFIPLNHEVFSDFSFDTRLLMKLNIVPRDSKYTEDMFGRYSDINNYKSFRLLHANMKGRDDLFGIKFTSITSGELDFVIEDMMHIHSQRQTPLTHFIRNVSVHTIDPSIVGARMEVDHLSEFHTARLYFEGLHARYDLLDNGPRSKHKDRLAAHFMYGEELDRWTVFTYLFEKVPEKGHRLRTSFHDSRIMKNCHYECTVIFRRDNSPNYQALTVENLTL